MHYQQDEKKFERLSGKHTGEMVSHGRSEIPFTTLELGMTYRFCLLLKKEDPVGSV